MRASISDNLRAKMSSIFAMPSSILLSFARLALGLWSGGGVASFRFRAGGRLPLALGAIFTLPAAARCSADVPRGVRMTLPGWASAALVNTGSVTCSAMPLAKRSERAPQASSAAFLLVTATKAS